MLIFNWFSFLKPCCPDGWLTANSNHRPAVVDNVAEEGAKILRNALFSNGLVWGCHKWFEIWIAWSKEHYSVDISIWYYWPNINSTYFEFYTKTVLYLIELNYSWQPCLVFEDVDIEVEGAGHRQSQVRYLYHYV